MMKLIMIRNFHGINSYYESIGEKNVVVKERPKYKKIKFSLTKAINFIVFLEASKHALGILYVR
jgi:hypothetical protein